LSEYVDMATIISEIDRLPVGEREKNIFKRFMGAFSGKKTYFAKAYTSQRQNIEMIRVMIDSGIEEVEIINMIQLRKGVCYNTARHWLSCAKLKKADPIQSKLDL
jgi:hypothetical protein